MEPLAETKPGTSTGADLGQIARSMRSELCPIIMLLGAIDATTVASTVRALLPRAREAYERLKAMADQLG